MLSLDIPVWVLVSVGVFAVAAVLVAVGCLIGHAFGEPDPAHFEAPARWLIELQLTHAQADPHATGYHIEGSDSFQAFVYATIDGVPGKHGLQGVDVTFDVNPALYTSPSNRKIRTGTDGVATLSVTTLTSGRTTVAAAATISGATQSVTSPMYEFQPARAAGRACL
jgi:hypothetical protein